jgi:hypothetical protein
VVAASDMIPLRAGLTALAFYEIDSVRRGGFSSVTEALPDETTILNFRHLLEKHQLTEKLLETLMAT